MSENAFGGQKPELPLERTPIIGKWIKDIAFRTDELVGQKGLSKGILSLIEEKQGKISVQYDSIETEKLLHEKNNPVIIVTTHASLVEPLAILASLSKDVDNPRDDISVLAADGMPQYPHLNSYLLPLYNTAPRGELRPDTTIFKSLGGRALYIDDKKALELNKENTLRAANDFRNGKLVFISPDGNRPKDAKWTPPGIGRLIQEIGPMSEGSLVFAEAEGGGMIEFVKIINPLLRPRPFQSVNVHFSEPISLKSIIERGKNKKALITSQLQDDYRSWLHK